MKNNRLFFVRSFVFSTLLVMLFSCSSNSTTSRSAPSNSPDRSQPNYSLWTDSTYSYIQGNRIGLEQKTNAGKNEFFTNCISDVAKKNISLAKLSFEIIDFSLYEKSEEKLDQVLLSVFAKQAVTSKSYLSVHRSIRQRYPDPNDKNRQQAISKLKAQYELKKLPEDIEQQLQEYEHTLSIWINDSVRKLQNARTNYRDFFGLAYMVQGKSTLPLGNLNNRVRLTGGRINCSGWRVWALKSDRYKDTSKEAQLYGLFEKAIEDKMVHILNQDIEEFKRLIYRLNSMRLINDFSRLYVSPEISRNALKRTGLYPIFLDKWRDLTGKTIWRGDNNTNLPYYRN